MTSQSTPEVHLIGDVNDENIKKLFNDVSKLFKEDPGRIIRLYISSNGGIVKLAFAFFNWVRLAGIKLETIVLGGADSAAVLILLSGDIRKAAKYSLITIHNISRKANKGTSLQPDEAISLAESMKKVQLISDNIIVERTGRTIQEVKDHQNKDIPFTAEEAKEFGLVHEVI